MSLLNIGSIYAAQGDFFKAHDSLERALWIAEEIEDKETIAFTSYSIGETYAIQGDYIKAIEYCQRSLDLAKEIGIVLVQKESYEYLYKAFKALGNST